MTHIPLTSRHTPYKVPILAVRYARRFARFMESRGIGRRALLSGSGLEPSQLDNPDAFLTMEEVMAVVQQAQQLLGDELAPFQFGQQLDFPAHGLLGFALMSQQSQSKLTHMIVQYLRVGLPVMDMEVSSTSRNIHLHLRDTWDLGPVRPFVAKIYMGSIHSLASQVCRSMRFECDFSSGLAPTQWQAQARCAEFHFDSGSCQVIMPLTERLPVDSVDTSYVLARERSRQSEQPERVTEVVAQVREFVSRDPGRGTSLDAVARKLDISARSLRSRLAEAGESFRDIRNDIREAYATRYLRDTSMALDIIAEKVGFSDQAAFTRAYRSWTGHTPGEVRRLAQN